MMQENKIKIIPIILAGGTGTRLWPLSRKSFPKQFLNLLDDDLTSIYQPDLQLQFSLIVLLAGFIASFLLFSRDPNGFKAAGVWLGLVAITGTIMQIITLTKMGDFYEEIPGIDSSLMTGIATGFSIGASLTCYLTVFAFIYIASKRSSDKEENIVESGFHKV